MPAHTVPTSTDRATVETRRKSRRRDIYEARRRVWAVTSLDRVRNCGWAPRSEDGVGIRVVECEGVRRAGLAGVQTCGSFWSCPVCSEKIAAHRQAQIEGILKWWTAETVPDMRQRVALVTMTVTHKKWQRLATVWDVVASCWHAVTSGRQWKAEQLRHGVPQLRQVASGARKGKWVLEVRVRTIRVVEVTHGRNGWHVHVHALLLLNHEATDATVEALGRSMWRRWQDCAKREGLGAADFDRVLDPRTGAKAVDVKLIHGDASAALGDYFVKAAWGAAWEVAGGMRKDSKNGNRTPFTILRDVVEPVVGSPLEQAEEDLALWREWEATSKGRRAVAFSPGLLHEAVRDAALQLDSDDEIASQDIGGETVAVVSPRVWAEIRRGHGVCDLLEGFEESTDIGLGLLHAWWQLVHADNTLPLRV